METTKQRQEKAFDTLKGDFGYTNKMSAPKIEKVVVSVGTGSRAKTDREWNNFVNERLAKITGQKPAIRAAKKSEAGFKIRTGDPIGQMVTLRGSHMYGFLDKLIHIAIPRTKDFRGFERSMIDNMGNLTLGIKEHVIFPETADEDIRNVFGLAITIVTTAKTKEEAVKFFELIGIPFKRLEE